MLTLDPIANLTTDTGRCRGEDRWTSSTLLEAWTEVAKLSTDDEVDTRLGDLLATAVEDTPTEGVGRGCTTLVGRDVATGDVGRERPEAECIA